MDGFEADGKFWTWAEYNAELAELSHGVAEVRAELAEQHVIIQQLEKDVAAFSAQWDEVVRLAREVFGDAYDPPSRHRHETVSVTESRLPA